jgi:hypothetical protein
VRLSAAGSIALELPGPDAKKIPMFDLPVGIAAKRREDVTMKKECEQTRRALSDYLRGHLFKTSRSRIERHLQMCIVCRSEYEALRRTEETRQILRDINATEGVVGRMKEGVSSIGKLKKLVYRPLWLAGIAAVAAALYYYAVTPRQLDLELERIVQTAPTLSAPTATALPVTIAGDATASTASGHAPAPELPPAAAPVPGREPLIVTIIPENDQSAVRRINEVMGGHGKLRKMQFSDTVKEVPGSLTSGELLAFFSRIETMAKVNYSRKRFESLPASGPVPFVLKLKAARKPAPQAAPAAIPAPPATEAALPAPPVTAPTASAVR